MSITPSAATSAPGRGTLVVGRGISLNGTIRNAGQLVVEGRFKGSLVDASALSIAAGGVFKGETEVADAEIAGTMDGSLTARGSLLVRNGGMVIGEARCRRLRVEDGGQITGRIEMTAEPAQSALPQPVPVGAAA